MISQVSSEPQRLAGREPLAQHRHRHRLDRQRVHGDALVPAQRRQPLLGAAQVERALQPELAQHDDVVVGQMAEMIGAEQLPPARVPAVLAGIAAEVAEIAGAGEIEVAGAI